MDFIFELILEIVFEGIAAGATSKRVPMVLRVLCASVIILLYLAVLALMFFVVFTIEDTLGKVICFIIALGLAVGGAYVARKKIVAFKKNKEIPEEENNDD